MAGMSERRVSVPIAVAVGLVLLTVALTVVWQFLVARGVGALAAGFSAIHWVLIVFGSLAFIAIITATILQAGWLVREIRLNQRQKNFLDAVTHELHTPLTSLRLYLDTLRGHELDGARREEFLDIMADDLGQLQRTIEQLLSAAQSEPRRALRQPVDLTRLLRECAGEARERHALEEGALTLDVPAHARVRGDAEQLRVAFRNLIDNAVRYAGARTRVDIRARALGGRKLEIAVADQGVGIPAGAHGRLFTRFARLSQEAVRSTRGLGLGLYIVRNVVRAHGGSVRAESEGEGRGSRFVVVLPGQLDEYAHPAR
jgi:signal transduction histidine kinase